MFEQAFKNIDDVLWKEAGCTTELDYTEQTSWLLFLKYLDGLEQDKATEGGPQKLNCVNTEGIFRLIQSIPGPKAEPFKHWPARVSG